MSTPKLPKNLPPLPPVPKGYDRWEYRGKGAAAGTFAGTFAYCETTDARWLIALGSPALDPVTHYIVAVRDPKPAPTVRKSRKVAAPKKRERRVVAQVMYLSPHGIAYSSYVQAKWNPSDLTKISAVPADTESVERMVKQMSEARYLVSRQAGAGVVTDSFPVGEFAARAALAAIGITVSRT